MKRVGVRSELASCPPATRPPSEWNLGELRHGRRRSRVPSVMRRGSQGVAGITNAVLGRGGVKPVVLTAAPSSRPRSRSAALQLVV